MFLSCIFLFLYVLVWSVGYSALWCPVKKWSKWQHRPLNFRMMSCWQPLWPAIMLTTCHFFRSSFFFSATVQCFALPQFRWFFSLALRFSKWMSPGEGSKQLQTIQTMVVFVSQSGLSYSAHFIPLQMEILLSLTQFRSPNSGAGYNRRETSPLCFFFSINFERKHPILMCSGTALIRLLKPTACICFCCSIPLIFTGIVLRYNSCKQNFISA